MASRVIADRIAGAIGSASFIREMFERGRRMKAEFGEDRVCDFSLGNPNAAPPQEFFDSLQMVAREHRPELHRYMPNAGFDETRAAVATFLSREYRIPLDPAGLILTSGAAGGMNVTLRTILNPGEEVIVLAPYFPEYRFYIEQAGGTMVLAQTDEHFQPDLTAIERAITPKTRAMIVNSPNNPTGAVYSEQSCRGLADLLARHDSDDAPIYLLTDDPYRRILYERDWCPTPAGMYGRSIIISSFSKDLSIAGERAGYLALPPSLPNRQLILNAMTMLNRTLGFVNMSAFMQRVLARCVEATCDQSVYRANRDRLCSALREMGYELEMPGGAFYAFPRTPLADDVAFCDLLTKERILAVPGRGFGRPGYMRLSFAVEPAVIERSLTGFRAARAVAISDGNVGKSGANTQHRLAQAH